MNWAGEVLCLSVPVKYLILGSNAENKKTGST